MEENERLTHKRVSGIKDGYWSSAKKEKLIQRLADYENTGFKPEEIKGLVDKIIDLGNLIIDDWIPASEPPESDKRCLVVLKHHAWISDYDSPNICKSEKIYHAGYTEYCEAIYKGDGIWKYMDLEDGYCNAYTNPKEDKSYPVDEVVKWCYMPLYQPSVCRYTGDSCCYPIDQCGECPNHKNENLEGMEDGRENLQDVHR